MPRQALYQQFLDRCTAFTGEDSEKGERQRYIRVYTAPGRSKADATYLEDLSPEFPFPGCTDEELADILDPLLEQLSSENTGFIHLECVDPVENYKIVKGATYKLACSGSALADPKANDALALRALSTAGIGAMFTSHASLADRAMTLAENFAGKYEALALSKVEDAAEYASLAAQIKAATEWASEQRRAEMVESVVATVWPGLNETLRQVGVAAASGAAKLGPRPPGPDSAILAWDLRAIVGLIRENKARIAGNLGLLTEADVVSAAQELGAEVKATYELAKAAGIDVSAFVGWQ